MDAAIWTVVRRIGTVGVLCAGAVIGSACGRDAATRVNVVGPSAVVGPSSVAAEGDGFGLTSSELRERGWTCRVTPAGATACSPPGRGLPVFGAPDDRPPSYLVHVFDTATGGYLGFSRMIRTDLYQGQTCPSTGGAYTELPHIGYYECFNPVS